MLCWINGHSKQGRILKECSKKKDEIASAEEKIEISLQVVWACIQKASRSLSWEGSL